MRVISKFHDYYDIGLSYGIDPKCVYVRETREIAFESLTGDNPAWLRDAMADEAFGKDIVGQLQHRRWDEDEWVDEVLVLFCGKAYLGIAYAGAYRWSWEALREAILAGPDTPLRRALETGKPQRSGRGWWFLPRYRELELSYAAADALNGRRPFLDAIHVGAGTPALAFRPDRKTGAASTASGPPSPSTPSSSPSASRPWSIRTRPSRRSPCTSPTSSASPRTPRWTWTTPRRSPSTATTSGASATPPASSPCGSRSAG